MKNISQATHFLICVLTYIVCLTTFVPVAYGQKAPPSNSNSSPPLIQQMAGTWNVEQRMWPGSGANAINLPSAIANRRLVGDAFLEEIMELPTGPKQEPFTRIAYFNYNAVNQQYEYFSIDTRAPQMMNEKSYEPYVQGKKHYDEGIKLYGGSFVASRWGDATNVAFRYRLTIGVVENNRQVVRLYLTPQSAERAKAFLAFEYVYTRQR